MAQVKLLKIASDGVPLEMNTAADDITLNSYTVQGGGPVLSGTGLDMNSQSVSDAASFQVTDPTSGYLNQTAGNLIFNNIMAKERSNVMTTAGDILFPVVSDSAGQVDAFRLPALAGVPTATPTASGEGFVVWDSTNDKMYVWNGSAWVDQTSISYAPSVQNSFVVGVGGVSARDFVYISGADTVLPADASAAGTAQGIGFALSTEIATANVQVQENGLLSGFSGLTAGARYYLSGATAGAITATVPVASGHTIVQAGYAKSASVLKIQIENLGRRA